MKNIYYFAKIAILAIIFNSCGAKSAEYADAVALTDISLDKNKSMAKSSQAENSAQEYSQKLKKTGEISFETSDLNKTKELITKTVVEMKGFIANDVSSQYDGRNQNTLTIRIPANNFDNLMDKISSSTSKIDNKSIEVEDVTQEYIDLDTRLKTKKELEARYLQLLQKATKVEEILKIEEQIGTLREDIESAEGQFRYLNNQISLSKITVTFYTNSAGYGFWYKLSQGFKNGWDNVLWVFIALANLWAVVLFGIVIIFLFRKWIKWRRVRKTQKK